MYRIYGHCCENPLGIFTILWLTLAPISKSVILLLHFKKMHVFIFLKEKLNNLLKGRERNLAHWFTAHMLTKAKLETQAGYGKNTNTGATARCHLGV